MAEQDASWYGWNRRVSLYLDENGNHSPNGSPYLGLCGCAVRGETYRTVLVPGLNCLKADFFGHCDDDPVVLHEPAVQQRCGHFACLADETKRRAFNERRIQLLREMRFRLLAVVIDKKFHFSRWGDKAWHPYHYCAEAMIERYVLLLRKHDCFGDVYAESRGVDQDDRLQDEYSRFWRDGTRHIRSEIIQQHLTSNSIKFRKKEQNIPGLQLSDMLAMSVRLDVLLEYGEIQMVKDGWVRRVIEAVAEKYDTSKTGNVRGYGKKLIK